MSSTARSPDQNSFTLCSKTFAINQLKDCLAIFIGMSCFYFLGFDENYSSSFSIISRIFLAGTGIYCILYFFLNKLNETFGIEGFEDQNKVYKPKIFDYAERKRKEACNLKMRGDKDSYRGQKEKKND